ncbi:response regulator, partial [bacterium]|nr:response regulator [candidate division CSSED10-310 bacterium]
METKGLISIIHDDAEDIQFIKEMIQEEFSEYEIFSVNDEGKFQALLSQQGCRLVITEYKLHWSDGIKILQIMKESQPECPVIMFTKSGNE